MIEYTRQNIEPNFLDQIIILPTKSNLAPLFTDSSTCSCNYNGCSCNPNSTCCNGQCTNLASCSNGCSCVGNCCNGQCTNATACSSNGCTCNSVCSCEYN